jgi:hypothetical protein
MNRLTVDERRRANELRRLSATARPSHVLTVDHLQTPSGAPWGRNARLATLITVILGGALAIVHLAQTLSLQGPASVVDWLLPRL